jgi:hypothetical protein
MRRKDMNEQDMPKASQDALKGQVDEAKDASVEELQKIITEWQKRVIEVVTKHTNASRKHLFELLRGGEEYEKIPEEEWLISLGIETNNEKSESVWRETIKSCSKTYNISHEKCIHIINYIAGLDSTLLNTVLTSVPDAIFNLIGDPVNDLAAQINNDSIAISQLNAKVMKLEDEIENQKAQIDKLTQTTLSMKQLINSNTVDIKTISENIISETM